MDGTHLRIAVTTNSLVQCDANFASAKQVVFYNVSRDDSEFVDVVRFSKSGRKAPSGGGGKAANNGRCVMEDMGDDDGTGFDPLVERVEALENCSVLFTLGMSDLAAVRIHAKRVYPVKNSRIRDIDDVIAQMQKLMRDTPPLWLRRVMFGRDGKRLPLDEQGI